MGPFGSTGLTSKERLAEDVARAVQWHRPDNQEDQRHCYGHPSCDLRCAHEMLLLLFVVCVVSVFVDCLRIQAGSADQGSVVASANILHGFPVVVLLTEAVGKDGNEDQRAQEGRDVARKHGVVGPRARDAQFSTFSACSD